MFVRAEGLKESQSKSAQGQTQDRTGPSGTKPSNCASSGGPVRQFFPLGPDFTLHDRPQPQPIRAVQSSEPQGQRYTSEEIEVLRWDCWKVAPTWLTLVENTEMQMISVSKIKIYIFFNWVLYKYTATAGHWNCSFGQRWEKSEFVWVQRWLDNIKQFHFSAI